MRRILFLIFIFSVFWVGDFFAQNSIIVDSISFNDFIINKKFLLHTNTQGFPLKEEGKGDYFKWKEVVEIGDLTNDVPFYEEIYDDEYGYEIKWDISFLYNEKEPDFIYISRISACKMYQIYFRFDGKLVNINKKRRDFFAKKFPKSYELYLKNQHKHFNGLYLKLKKDNDYAYIVIYFKKSGAIEEISVETKTEGEHFLGRK